MDTIRNIMLFGVGSADPSTEDAEISPPDLVQP
jgi:hypothetical protein